jgi:hypothetical protein
MDNGPLDIEATGFHTGGGYKVPRFITCVKYCSKLPHYKFFRKISHIQNPSNYVD